jgi:hypothetical protein
MKKRRRAVSFELHPDDLRRAIDDNSGISVQMVVTHANIRLVAMCGGRKIDIRPVQTATAP